MLYLMGLGDFPIKDISIVDDPCPSLNALSLDNINNHNNNHQDDDDHDHDNNYDNNNNNNNDNINDNYNLKDNDKK
jgi:hypothetical protein